MTAAAQAKLHTPAKTIEQLVADAAEQLDGQQDVAAAFVAGALIQREVHRGAEARPSDVPGLIEYVTQVGVTA